MDDKAPNAFRIISKAAATGWIAQISGLLVSFITIPLIISHLGKTEYGVWTLVGQVIGILALSDLGVTNTVGRFVARFRGSNDQEAINKLLVTVLIVMVLLGLGVALLTLIISSWIPGLLGIHAAYSRIARLVFIIAGLSLALQFPFRMGFGIVTGYQRYDLENATKTVRVVLYLAGILFLANLKTLGLAELALVNATAVLVTQSFMFFLAWRTVGPLSLKVSYVSFSMLKDVLSLGASALSITLTALIYNQGIVIAVGRFMGIEEAGIYGIALTLVTFLSRGMMQFVRPVTTLASELQERNRLIRLQRTSNAVMRIVFALGTSAAAGSVFYGEAFLRMLLRNSDWSTQDYHQAALALSIMSLGLAIGIPQMVSRSVLQGVGLHWSVSRRFGFASLASFALGGLLMYMGFGIQGAALGWSFVWLFQGFLLYPPLICRYFHQSAATMIAQAYLPGGLVGLFVLLLAWGLSSWLPPSDLLGLLVGVVVCLAFGGLGILLISGRSGMLWSSLRGSKRVKGPST